MTSAAGGEEEGSPLVADDVMGSHEQGSGRGKKLKCVQTSFMYSPLFKMSYEATVLGHSSIRCSQYDSVFLRPPCGPDIYF